MAELNAACNEMASGRQSRDTSSTWPARTLNGL